MAFSVNSGAGNDTFKVTSGNLPHGDGTFGPQATMATGSGPRSVAVGDFNGDGIIDLAVANETNNAAGTVSVLLGKGNGAFDAQATYAAASAPVSVAAADFNGDTKLDLAVANYFGNTLSVLLGNGNGTFAPQVTFATGNGPIYVAAGDLNSDGKADLAVINYVDSAVGVFIGNGNGSFVPQTTIATGGSNSRSVAVWDLNGDGKADLAVANDGGPAVSILLGCGNANFASQVTFAAGSRPFAAAIGDLMATAKPTSP